MFKIKNLFNRLNSNKNSNVVYENRVVRNEIMSWCNEIGVRDVNVLLRMIGIDTDRKIYLYQDYGNLYSVIYSVGMNRIDNNNFIKFNSKRKEIVVNDRDVSKCYRFGLNSFIDDDGDPVLDRYYQIDADLVYCRKRIDDKICLYNRINKNNSLFVLDNGLYELMLEIDTCANICDDEYDDLGIYLSSLEFPVNIESVYKDICYILSLEQEIMDKFSLSVTKSIDKRKPDKVMDEIMIENGVLERVTITRDGISVMLDKFGNYVYEGIDVGAKYCYRGKNIDTSMLDEDVNKEIDNVKRLVKEIWR